MDDHKGQSGARGIVQRALGLDERQPPLGLVGRGKVGIAVRPAIGQLSTRRRRMQTCERDFALAHKRGQPSLVGRMADLDPGKAKGRDLLAERRQIPKTVLLSPHGGKREHGHH